jgi:5'(3')-deoxyribonucleotidase
MDTAARPLRLYIDMDGCLIDFETGIARLASVTVNRYAGRLDEVPGIFGLMEPMPGAVEAYRRLAAKYDTYILSTAPWENPTAWSDKLRTVQTYFPDARKRLILSHNKHLNDGDFLIDDRPNNGAAEFPGEWLHFGPNGDYPDWDSILDRLAA